MCQGYEQERRFFQNYQDEKPPEKQASAPMDGSIADRVPTSWLDPLLTGPNAILPPGHAYGPQDIENLLRAIKDRIKEAEAQRQ